MKDFLILGVYLPSDIPQSFRVYAENILKYFPALGINTVFFKNAHDLPKTADVLWDIRSGGGSPPLDFMLGCTPLVITTHGFAPITLSGWEYFRTLSGAIMSRRYAKQKIARWHQLKDGVNAIIAVSDFSKMEAIRITGVPAEKIYVCHHGVNFENFAPDPKKQNKKPYLLHISNHEPRKNVPRIVNAFQRLKKDHDIQLILKLPSKNATKYLDIPGITIIEKMLSDEEIANLYRDALAFIFPSLYEGFGLPILEAMACGCPVITSNTTACPEVAGNAAIIIDPRNEDELYHAMIKVCENSESNQLLTQSGYQRAREFSWKTVRVAMPQCLEKQLAYKALMKQTLTSPITVIIPYYQTNPEPLKRAITSILNQEDVATTPNIIIVDDSSPFPARDIIDQYFSEYTRHILIHHQPNSGAAKARNTGLDNLPNSTQYIAFIDSDDEWTNKHLSNAMQILRHGYDFYFSDHQRPEWTSSKFNQIGINLNHHHLINDFEQLYEYIGDPLNAIMHDHLIQTSSVVLSVSILHKNRFPVELVLGEDEVFWVKAIRAARKIGFSAQIEVNMGKGVNISQGGDYGSDRSFQLMLQNILYWQNVPKLLPNEPSLQKICRYRIEQLSENMASSVLFRIKGFNPPPLRIILHFTYIYPLWILKAFTLILRKLFIK